MAYGIYIYIHLEIVFLAVPYGTPQTRACFFRMKVSSLFTLGRTRTPKPQKRVRDGPDIEWKSPENSRKLEPQLRCT